MAGTKMGHNRQHSDGKICPHCGGIKAVTYRVLRPVVKASGAIGQRALKVFACSISCYNAQVG
jgi:hypothetical protein